jgi:hypothetical protein
MSRDTLGILAGREGEKVGGAGDMTLHAFFALKDAVANYFFYLFGIITERVVPGTGINTLRCESVTRALENGYAIVVASKAIRASFGTLSENRAYPLCPSERKTCRQRLPLEIA